MGLAWTSMGGSTLYVECTNVNGGPRWADGDESEVSVGRVRSTGQLGDVMIESLSIAHCFSTRYLNKIARGNVTLQRDDLQLHVPEGATPKDGPSAGKASLS
jgi:Lon-like ATP-dependent protease